MAYFPNSTAGEVFDNQCCSCFHEAEDVLCPVAAIQAMYNYDQLKKGNEDLREAMLILVDDAGTCKVRELILKKQGRASAKCLQRPLVFGDEDQIKVLKSME